jgi:1,4-dihydroxy-2-naphthoate octaprenyltransferase
MDYEHDKRAKKMTLAVLLSNRTAQMVFSALFMLMPYCCIITGITLHILSYWYLITFITLPLAGMLYYLLWMFIKYPEKNYKPRWWMQPMERWQQIEQAGIDWFMIRWYLSRNLTTYFCLIVAILSWVG